MSRFLVPLSLPEGFRQRPADLRDAANVTALFNRCCREFGEPEAFTSAETLSDWTAPGFSLQQHTRVLEDARGLVRGYAAWWKSRKTENCYSSWFRVAPGVEREALLRWLLAWLESCVQEELGSSRGILESFQPEKDSEGNALLLAETFEPARSSWRMERGLTGPLSQPLWPPGIHLESGKTIAAVEFYRLAEQAFQGQWNPAVESFDVRFQSWLHQQQGAEGFDLALWFMALQSQQPVAFLIGCQSIGEEPEVGWVELLGVAPDRRGQGLGQSLLAHAFQIYQSLGRERVALSVTTSNPTGALRLYEAVGMEKVSGWIVFQKAMGLVS